MAVGAAASRSSSSAVVATRAQPPANAASSSRTSGQHGFTLRTECRRAPEPARPRCHAPTAVGVVASRSSSSVVVATRVQPPANAASPLRASGQRGFTPRASVHRHHAQIWAKPDLATPLPPPYAFLPRWREKGAPPPPSSQSHGFRQPARATARQQQVGRAAPRSHASPPEPALRDDTGVFFLYFKPNSVSLDWNCKRLKFF
uniref:Uncharacterized protein n=1 Tax=Oryza brachyantha TaxID=4533 RepID=J3MRN8_ORYBR